MAMMVHPLVSNYFNASDSQGPRSSSQDDEEDEV